MLASSRVPSDLRYRLSVSADAGVGFGVLGGKIGGWAERALSLARDAVRGGADSLAVRSPGVSGELATGTDEIYVASSDICRCDMNDRRSFGGCAGSLVEVEGWCSTRTVRNECNCSSKKAWSLSRAPLLSRDSQSSEDVAGGYSRDVSGTTTSRLADAKSVSNADIQGEDTLATRYASSSGTYGMLVRRRRSSADPTALGLSSKQYRSKRAPARACAAVD